MLYIVQYNIPLYSIIIGNQEILDEKLGNWFCMSEVVYNSYYNVFTNLSVTFLSVLVLMLFYKSYIISTSC